MCVYVRNNLGALLYIPEDREGGGGVYNKCISQITDTSWMGGGVKRDGGRWLVFGGG